jgi:Glycosyl transferase family 2
VTEPRRPTLSVAVVTRDSGTRLGALLDHVGAFADQIVVAVDDASTDDTFDVARSGADVTFRFAARRMAGTARMLALDHARGDWVLSIDDDERLSSGFAELLPELLADARHSHYWFPRTWAVSWDPPTFVRDLPWFPDWQLRLFRNDRRIVWHPAAVHVGYLVAGTGCHEARTSIVHLERLWTTNEQRQAKLRRYEDLRGDRRHGDFYAPVRADATLAPLRPAAAVAPGAGGPARGARAIDGVLVGVEPGTPPPWGASLQVAMPRSLTAGAREIVDLRAWNTGGLRWVPPRLDWPRLFLSYHVARLDGTMLEWDGARTPVGRIVDPGEEAGFLVLFEAPEEPGDYLVGWDVVDEGDVWFSQCGSRIPWSPLQVIGRPRGGRRGRRR